MSIKTKNEMYRLSIIQSGAEYVEKYKKYKNLLRICLHKAEVRYYNDMTTNLDLENFIPLL